MTYQIIASKADLNILNEAGIKYNITGDRPHELLAVDVTIETGREIAKLIHHSWMQGLNKAYDNMKQPAY